jgi:hypothetical protein
MFGTTLKKSTLAVLTAAALASAVAIPAASAQSLMGGNASQIPPFMNTNAYYSSGTPAVVVTPQRLRHHQTPVVERSTTNPNCQGGYTWSDSMAGNGMSIPTACHG